MDNNCQVAMRKASDRIEELTDAIIQHRIDLMKLDRPFAFQDQRRLPTPTKPQTLDDVRRETANRRLWRVL